MTTTPLPTLSGTLLIRLVSILIFGLLSPLYSCPQCVATSYTSGSNAWDDNSIGSLAFSNTTNVYASNNSRATATAVASLFTGSSEYLMITGFGFSIPSYATICGIEVQIEKRATGITVGAWIRDHEVRLVINGNVAGSNRGHTSTDWPTTDTYDTYGGSSDTWGLSLTNTDVNNVNFGVAIASKFNGLVGVFPSAQIDHIQVSVYFNPILPVRLLDFSTSLNKNQVTATWETTHEEDDEQIELQRKADTENQWTTLHTYTLHESSSIRSYAYTDTLKKEGDYAYRLRITNKNLVSWYSAIKNVHYTGPVQPKLFPNPSRDYITLTHITYPATVTVRSLMQQHYKIPVQVTGDHTVILDIRSLPPGIYLAEAGPERLKFIRQ